MFTAAFMGVRYIKQCRANPKTIAAFIQSNLMIKQEIFFLLILIKASLAKHSAASCGSSMCLMRLTAS